MSVYSYLWHKYDYIYLFLLATSFAFFQNSLLQLPPFKPFHAVSLAVFMPTDAPNTPPDLLNKLATYSGVAHVENIVNSNTLLEKDQQQSLLDILQTTDPDASIPDTIIITTDLKHQDKIKNMLFKQYKFNAYQLYTQHPPYSVLVCFVFFLCCYFFFLRGKNRDLHQICVVLRSIKAGHLQLIPIIVKSHLLFWAIILCLQPLLYPLVRLAAYHSPASPLFSLALLAPAIVLTFMTFYRTISKNISNFL